jgi:hypothetical protein
MPKNKYNSIGEIDLSSSGYSPYEEIWQSAISQTPGVFDYAELDKKYPTRQVRPIVPPYIQRQLNEDLLEQKEQLATQRIRDAQASIYESQLNEKLQTANQVILAREAFSQLDPQDPNYPDKRDKIFMDLPFAEDDTSFMKSVVGRNDRLYENYFKKNLAVKNLTLKDLDDSYKTIQAIEESAANRGGLSPMEEDLRNMHRTRIKAGLQQQGISGEDSDIAQARNLISKRPELKDEVNKRLISAGKQPIP